MVDTDGAWVPKDILWGGAQKQIIHPVMGQYKKEGKDFFYFGVWLPTKFEVHTKNRTFMDEKEGFYLMNHEGFYYRRGDIASIEFQIKPQKPTKCWSIQSIRKFAEHRFKMRIQYGGDEDSNRGNLKHDLNRFLSNQYLLHDTIVKFLKNHIEFKTEAEYHLLACWIMGTYIHDIFEAYPYIHLFGHPDTGKTQVLESTALLSFNGFNTTTPSASNVYRMITAYKTTMCIDEIDMRDPNSTPKKEELYQVILTGYKKGNTIPRSSDRDKDKLLLYDAYSPKMFAGTKGLDDVLSTRSIEIVMPKSKKKFHRPRDDEIAQQIRDDCYIWALENWSEVKTIYETDIQEEDFPELSGRNWEIWRPILALAAHTNVLDEVRKLMGEKMEVAEEDKQSENPSIILLQEIASIPTTDGGWRSLKTIRFNFQQRWADMGERTDWITERWISKELKKTPGLILSKRRMKNGFEILVSEKVLSTLLTEKAEKKDSL